MQQDLLLVLAIVGSCAVVSREVRKLLKQRRR
jgi:hypothetical protein